MVFGKALGELFKFCANRDGVMQVLWYQRGFPGISEPIQLLPTDMLKKLKSQQEIPSDLVAGGEYAVSIISRAAIPQPLPA
jgi:hypothetical protein